MTKIITCSKRAAAILPEGKQSPNARRMGNHNQEARCLQADSDTRKSMPASPRSEEVGFAHDSALEEAGFELSVPPERKAALDRVRRPSVTRRQA
jgi:hypothetical protein